MSDIPVRACVRSGYCCKKSLCAFGEYQEGGKLPCKHLGGDKPGEYYCKQFDEINKKVWAKWNPAFGAGCCSPIGNTARDEVIQRRGEGEVYVLPADGTITGNDLKRLLGSSNVGGSKKGRRSRSRRARKNLRGSGQSDPPF